MKASKMLKPNDEKRIKRNYARIKGLIEHAGVAFKTGDLLGGMRRSGTAFKLARENVDLLRGTSAEPIRAHMHFVAAALAMDLKKYDRVIELADWALEGNPPEKLATDLHTLRQAAMHARIHSNGEGDGTGHRGHTDQASGSHATEGCDPGDCEVSANESGHGEQVCEPGLQG